MALLSLITKEFKGMQHLKTRKNNLDIMKKIKPFRNKLIMRI
jgi:hypothetical protein